MQHSTKRSGEGAALAPCAPLPGRLAVVRFATSSVGRRDAAGGARRASAAPAKDRAKRGRKRQHQGRER